MARNETELHRFFVKDEEALKAAGPQWVRDTTPPARDEILEAGNPREYVQEIDGATVGGRGKVKKGKPFKSGAIENAMHSVRISWVGGSLAPMANSVRALLLALIRETFPQALTKKLETRWVWYVQEDAINKGKNTPARLLGTRVPDEISIYDVLWLAPEGEEPAAYAWFANRLALRKYGARWNKIKKYQYAQLGKKWVKRVRRVVRRRPRGFMAEATRMIRGSKAAQQAGPVLVQAKFIPHLTGHFSRGDAKTVPVIRVSFRRGLSKSVDNGG